MLAVWTARLAITKGRNGWTWGAAALILGLLPWHLIGVIPVLALMFVKTPVDLTANRTASQVCVRCNKPHSDGQHFCTGCGWDLNEPNSVEEFNHEQTSVNEPLIPTAIDSTVLVQGPDDTEPSIAEPISDHFPEPSATTLGNEQSALDSETGYALPQEEHIPWGTYDVGEAPTPEIMVSRGIEKFLEGKFQEAIDQFTKAIALDPNYAEAWERRSEAYTQLGRPRQAEDDRRHLQGLDPSSYPS